MLVVFSGLPGVGKTTLARSTAARLSAAFVRIDELDSALRRAGIDPEQPIGPATYLAANAVAEACRRVGTPVVVDGEHRRRVESRTSELEGVPAPTWADVGSRVYEPWREPRLVVDTSLPLATSERDIDEYLRAG